MVTVDNCAVRVVTEFWSELFSCVSVSICRIQFIVFVGGEVNKQIIKKKKKEKFADF